jgi:hypothetical protein
MKIANYEVFIISFSPYNSLSSKFVLSNLFSFNLKLHSSLRMTDQVSHPYKNYYSFAFFNLHAFKKDMAAAFPAFMHLLIVFKYSSEISQKSYGVDQYLM